MAERGNLDGRFAAVLVFLVAAMLLLARLGHFPLMMPDEVRNAEVGREMFESGAWLVPTYNGLAYLDKPAFHFKFVALAFAAFGVNEAAARLPSALSGLAMLVALFLFARRTYDRHRAVLAVMIATTVPLFIAFSRLVILDTMFTLCVCLAIFAGFLAEEREGRGRTLWHAAAAAAGALATLVKGPIGFLLPWVVLSAFFVCDRRPRALLRLFSPLNLLVLFGLVLPWFLMLSQRHPDFPHYGLVRETFERFTQGEVFRRRKPLYFYIPMIAGTFFVWSVLLPESILAAWRSRARWTRVDRLCIVWACAVVVFFSLPESKQPGYVLSVTVPVSLLLAHVCAGAMNGTLAAAVGVVRRGAMALSGLCLVLAAMLGTFWLRPEAAAGWLNSSRERIDAMLPHLPQMAIACILFAGLAALACLRRSQRLAFVTFAAFLPVLAWSAFDGLEVYAASRSGRSVVDRLPPLPPGTELVCLQCFPLDAPFYLQRTLTLITERGKEMPSNYIPYALANPKKPWPRNVVPLGERDRWLAGHAGPLYVIGTKRCMPTLEKLAAAGQVEVQDLSRGYAGVLLTRTGVR